MLIAQRSPVPGSTLSLKYVGGDPSLNLINTVDWTERGLENDRLGDYAQLTRWAEGAGVASGATAARLRRVAAKRPREAKAVLDAARRLRAVLQRIFVTVAKGEQRRVALNDLNDFLGDALRSLRLTSVERRRASEKPIRWEWRGLEHNLDSVLWPVTWSAATLLASEEATRVRVCAGPGCGWMYVDRSRNGLRRWCQMETCGTRAKSRRRAERARRSG